MCCSVADDGRPAFRRSEHSTHTGTSPPSYLSVSSLQCEHCAIKRLLSISEPHLCGPHKYFEGFSSAFRPFSSHASRAFGLWALERPLSCQLK